MAFTHGEVVADTHGHCLATEHMAVAGSVCLPLCSRTPHMASLERPSHKKQRWHMGAEEAGADLRAEHLKGCGRWKWT